MLSSSLSVDTGRKKASCSHLHLFGKASNDGAPCPSPSPKCRNLRFGDNLQYQLLSAKGTSIFVITVVTASITGFLFVCFCFYFALCSLVSLLLLLLLLLVTAAGFVNAVVAAVVVVAIAAVHVVISSALLLL